VIDAAVMSSITLSIGTVTLEVSLQYLAEGRQHAMSVDIIRMHRAESIEGLPLP